MTKFSPQARAIPGRRSPRLARQAGLSLVELMVSLVISLLVGLAALSSAQFFAGMQRQTTGINAVVANTATAFSAIKFEGAQAGLGFFDKGSLACSTFNVSKGSAAAFSGATVLPASIALAGTVPTLNLFYAKALESSGATTLVDATSNAAASAQIASFLPVQAGQDVLLVPSSPGVPCTLKTVTGTVADTGSGQVLNFDSTGSRNQFAFPAAAYAAGDSLLLTGGLQAASFTLAADASSGLNNLVMARPLDGTSAVLAKNIVAMVMQYGVADNGDATVSGWRYPKAYPLLESGPQDWTSSALTGAQLVSQVKAVRVAVLMRSEQRDKKVNGKCTTTASMPSLLGTVLGQPPLASEGLAAGDMVTSALTGDWQCYRYAESSVVVPLRNLIFGKKT